MKYQSTHFNLCDLCYSGHSSWIHFPNAPTSSKTIYLDYHYLYFYVDSPSSHLLSKMWRTNGRRISVENRHDVIIDTNVTKILDAKSLNETHFVILYAKDDHSATPSLSSFPPPPPPPSLYIVLGFIDSRNNYDLHFYPPFLIQSNGLSNSTAVILQHIYIVFSYYEIDSIRPFTHSLVVLKVTPSEAGFTVVYRAPQRDTITNESSLINLCKATSDNQFILVEKSAAYLYSLTDNEKLENIHSLTLSLPSHLYKGLIN